jgi:hypothetical protein
VVVVDLAWSAWGDGRRRGGDRRGKVDAEGLSSCRRRGVVVVAVYATREVVEVVEVVDVAWSWLRSTRHARRSWPPTEVVVVEAMWWRSSSSA